MISSLFLSHSSSFRKIILAFAGLYLRISSVLLLGYLDLQNYIQWHEHVFLVLLVRYDNGLKNVLFWRSILEAPCHPMCHKENFRDPYTHYHITPLEVYISQFYISCTLPIGCWSCCYF